MGELMESGLVAVVRRFLFSIPLQRTWKPASTVKVLSWLRTRFGLIMPRRLPASSRRRKASFDFGYAMKPTFHLALTADFCDAAGKLKFPDVGLSLLAENPQIKQSYFKDYRNEIGAEQIGNAQGVLVLAPNVTATVFRTRKVCSLSRG